MSENNESYEIYDSGFTQISNELFRRVDMSLKAKALLGYLLSHDYNKYKLKKSNLHNLLKEGRTSIKNAWDELVKYGYIKTEVSRSEVDGRFIYTHHIAPDARFLYTVNPSTDNPTTVNVQPKEYYNKNTKKEKEKNTKKEIPYIDLGDGIKAEEPRDWNKGQFTDEDRDSYKKFLLRIYERYPRVWELKKPTLLLFTEMVCKFGKSRMDEVLRDMENWPKIHTKETIGLTMDKWLNKRMKEEEQQRINEQAKRMG